ncbi:MAG: carbohydrate binding domain-containing protein, partial [Armatimonadetes bacterium]|nr:carbohydrate binding domain-containing protein [Armatimonadota bacterium]
DFLRKRYGTTAKLRAAWSEGEVPLGKEQVTNGDFTRGLEGWTVQSMKPCKATGTIVAEGPEGAKALKVEVTQTDATGWHGQVFFAPIALKQKRHYTLTLWLRAEPARSVAVNVMRAHPPYGTLGFRTTVSVPSKWRQYRFAFVSPADEEKARVTVSNLATSKGTVWIAGLSLREGGVLGLPEDQSLEKGTVRRIRTEQFEGRTPAAVRDQALFYLNLERSYWQEMYDYLKHDLGAQALVTGTQITYSPPYTQEMMDYADVHAYWQHPRFPGRPWDRKNWYVQNISMVANPPGTIERLACCRIAGKPYTVSEYNHPAPNQYGGEAFLLLAAYGAFQDWDAIYSFNFSSNDTWDEDHVSSYFDTKAHPTQVVSLPAAAAMFRLGAIAPAQQELVAEGNLELALKVLPHRQQWVSVLDAGLKPGDELRHRVALRWIGHEKSRGRAGRAALPQEQVTDKRRWVADHGQLLWDASEQGKEVVLLRAPAAKGVIGFCCGREFDLGDGVRLQVGDNSLHWAAITLTQREGKPLASGGPLLVTVASAYRNPDWGWQDLERGRVTLGPNWGHGPGEAEGTPLTIVLPAPPARVQAWALDPQGRRKTIVKPQAAPSGGTRLPLGPEYGTLWYEVRLAPQ